MISAQLHAALEKLDEALSSHRTEIFYLTKGLVPAVYLRDKQQRLTGQPLTQSDIDLLVKELCKAKGLCIHGQKLRRGLGKKGYCSCCGSRRNVPSGKRADPCPRCPTP